MTSDTRRCGCGQPITGRKRYCDDCIRERERERLRERNETRRSKREPMLGKTLTAKDKVLIHECDEWPRSQLPRGEVMDLLARGWMPEGLRVRCLGREYQVVGAEFTAQRLEAVA